MRRSPAPTAPWPATTRQRTHAREAWTKLRATLGDDDREAIDAERRLAAILIDKSEFDEGEKLLDDARQRLSRTLGPEDVEVGATLGELGRIYQSTGRMKEAEEAIRACLAICVRRSATTSSTS